MDYTIDVIVTEGYYDYKLWQTEKALKHARWAIPNPIIMQDIKCIEII